MIKLAFFANNIVSVQIIESEGPPVVGQSYNLTCNVSESANNITNYHWKKEGASLINETDKTLAFPSFHLSDAGNYICEVSMESKINGMSDTVTVIPLSELF